MYETVLTLWPIVFFLVIFFVRPVRRNVLSRFLKSMFRKAIPRISKTEEQALLAGTVWWDGELFSGKPDWRKITDLPVPDLLERERTFIDGPVEKLCAMLDEWEIVRERKDLSPEEWEFLKNKGFFGMIIPQRYGGLGFSATAHSAVITKLAGRSITAAVTAMVPNSLGPAQLLLRYGTDHQKEYYLPRLADGREMPCFALTSREAGSDAASMQDNGIICRADFKGEQQVLGIKLNWDKRYITLAPVASILCLAFKLYDPEHLIGEEVERGITLALVPTALSGVEVGKRHLPLDQAFQNGPTRGHDVFIPLDYVIGGADRVGQGWLMLMECLADGRSISLPALSAGVAKLVTRSTGSYARIRKQFTNPIGNFEGVQEALARTVGNTYAIDSLRLMTARAIDQGEKPSVISAIVKYHCTERMRKTVNDAMDIFGGTAICLGPRNLLGAYYESIPISITVEGANILTRSLIIFGQGIIRCHPFLLTEMKAVRDDDLHRGLKDFDRAFWGHLLLAHRNMARTFILAIGGHRFVSVPLKGLGAKFARQVARLSAAIAMASEAAVLVLGAQLKRRENLSARLGDVLAQLYTVTAAIKRFQDQNCPEDDAVILEWVCRDSLFAAQEQLYGFIDNFPSPFIVRILKLLIFPLGRRFRPPNDLLNKRVAQLFMEPSEARNRLTDGIFISLDETDRMGRIENAFQQQVNVVELTKRVRKDLKKLGIRPENDALLIKFAGQENLIGCKEERQLQKAYDAMLRAIDVDEF